MPNLLSSKQEALIIFFKYFWTIAITIFPEQNEPGLAYKLVHQVGKVL